MDSNRTSYPALRCRCSHEMREQVDNRLDELCVSETAYLLNLVQTDLKVSDGTADDKDRIAKTIPSTVSAMQESAYCSDSDLRFSMPHDGGITIYIDGDDYQLFPTEREPFYISMLKQIVDSTQLGSEETIFYFQDEKNSKITMQFHGSTHDVTICRNGFYKTYPVGLEDFCDLWLSYLHRHNVYYVAPDYLNVITGRSFEEMCQYLTQYIELGRVLYEKAKGILSLLSMGEGENAEKEVNSLQKQIDKLRKQIQT